VLVLCGAHEAPFSSIGSLFDKVTPELGARANAAYTGGGTRLVWKDAYGEGRLVNRRCAAAVLLADDVLLLHLHCRMSQRASEKQSAAIAADEQHVVGCGCCESVQAQFIAIQHIWAADASLSVR
jgi:hypothetical protein